MHKRIIVQPAEAISQTTAQDIVQDTLLQAMNTWSYNGTPENPQAWFYRVAKNKAIDVLRRKRDKGAN